MRKRFGILVLCLLIVAASAVAYFPLTRPPSNRPSISWDGAIAVLHTGQVTRIFQTHHLEVSLWLKNGTVMIKGTDHRRHLPRNSKMRRTMPKHRRSNRV